MVTWDWTWVLVTVVDLVVDLVTVVDLIFSDLAVDLIFSRWWIWSQLWIWLWIWSRLGLDLRWLNSCGGVFVGLWWPVMGLCWVCGGGGGWEGFGLWLLGLYG
uniref:Uncharacterized protein n=1 Tax=Fagus sylvatica TaxID=28930 RepID=A0A2N9J5A3_FAGSY